MQSCVEGASCRISDQEWSVIEQKFLSFIFLAYVIVDLDQYVLLEFCCKDRQNYALIYELFLMLVLMTIVYKTSNLF